MIKKNKKLLFIQKLILIFNRNILIYNVILWLSGLYFFNVLYLYVYLLYLKSKNLMLKIKILKIYRY